MSVDEREAVVSEFFMERSLEINALVKKYANGGERLDSRAVLLRENLGIIQGIEARSKIGNRRSL
jgi:hypothetical protein